MIGLGDLVALLARTLGVAQTPACGCQHRRELLNKMVPFPRRLHDVGRAGHAGSAGR